MSDNNVGSEHPNWKGNGVGKSGIHERIKKLLCKATKHSCALKDETCKGPMQWSNKSGKYKWDISDWWVLCQSHHIRYDMTDEWRRNMSEARKKDWDIRRLKEQTT